MLLNVLLNFFSAAAHSSAGSWTILISDMGYPQKLKYPSRLIGSPNFNSRYRVDYRKQTSPYISIRRNVLDRPEFVFYFTSCSLANISRMRAKTAFVINRSSSSSPMANAKAINTPYESSRVRAMLATSAPAKNGALFKNSVRIAAPATDGNNFR